MKSKKLKVRILSLFATTMLITSFINFSVVKADTQGPTEIKIFHTNDVHSRVDNYSKVKKYIDSYDEKLLIDAGDTLHGQSFATLENGSSIAKIMKALDYDAIAPGNHDFNYGYQRLKELGEESGVPILAANVTKNGINEYGSYILKEVNGVKVGIFGLSTPETAYKTNPKNVEGLEFGTKESVIKTSKRMVEKLKGEDAEVIIAITHLGIDTSSDIKSTDIGSNVEGIDLIIDGHSHSSLEAYSNFNANNKTKITSTSEYLNNLGEVTIRIEEDGKKNIELKSVKLSELNEKDEEVNKLISDIKAGQESILNTIVGATPIKLDGSREKVRWGHTNLGRLITSAMIDETGADISITNGGGIRDSINEGDISKGDIIKVLPFGNYIITKSVKGEDIIKALEHGMVEGGGSFTHFGGMEVYGTKYTDEAGKVKWKVNDVKINGKLMEKDKSYIVATNDFMAAGGDGYEMFGQYPTLNEYSALDEALITYISKIGSEGIVSIDKEVRLIEGDLEEEVIETPGDGDNTNNLPNEGNKTDIENDVDGSMPPKTGDSSSIVTLITLLVASGILLKRYSKKELNEVS